TGLCNTGAWSPSIKAGSIGRSGTPRFSSAAKRSEPTFGILRCCKKNGNLRRPTVRLHGHLLLTSLAPYGPLTLASHYGRCEPALRQALRTCTTTLLILLVLTNAYCSFTAAGNAPAQSALAAATMLIPQVQVQNTPTVITIGSSASPVYPLKA